MSREDGNYAINNLNAVNVQNIKKLYTFLHKTLAFKLFIEHKWFKHNIKKQNNLKLYKREIMFLYYVSKSVNYIDTNFSLESVIWYFIG